jgi:predicted ribosome quality control (RQC) complex YloA/Tae2 family protein
MMNHYFFIRQLAFELDQQLRGATIEQLLSSSKDELFFQFKKEDKSHQLRLNWETNLSLLQFLTDTEHLPRQYEKQLFDAWGGVVSSVDAFIGERIIRIRLQNGLSIYLKLFGQTGNALLMQGQKVISVFRRSKQKDYEFDPTMLLLDSPETDFETIWNHLGATHKVFSQSSAVGLLALDYSAKSSWFKAPRFEILKEEIYPKYTECINDTFSQLELSNHFLRIYLPFYLFDREKLRLLSPLKAALEKIEKRLADGYSRLQSLAEKDSFELKGHLLLANAHQLAKGLKEVTLENWNTPPLQVRIKLNPDISIADNATRFYEKGKNQHIEKQKLEEYIHTLHEELQQKEQKITAIESIVNLKELNKYIKKEKATSSIIHPWRVMKFASFEVWIGKNATGNDELLRVVHKDDLWLHARLVTGSHVVIRNAGRKVPQNVLEQVASWAAWYSKSKNESLSPVIYTPRKFVRKPKGAKPGAVLVEKEQVIMVPPMPPMLPNQ